MIKIRALLRRPPRNDVSDYCRNCGNEKTKCTCGNTDGWFHPVAP